MKRINLKSDRMLRALRQFNIELQSCFGDLEDDVRIIFNKISDIKQDNIDFKNQIKRLRLIDDQFLYSCRFLDVNELIESQSLDHYINHLKILILTGEKEEVCFSFNELKRLKINQENIG